jgi:hypothetical protein
VEHSVAFNGIGIYSLPGGNPVTAGTLVTDTWANTTLSDVAVALSSVVVRDGQSPMTGPMRIADGTLLIPSLTFNSEPKTGLYKISTRNMGLCVDGVLKISLSDTGISITSPVTITGDLTSGGNIYPSASSTTTMTNGFVYMPSAAGAPTGVPSTVTGHVPFYYDTTANQFYVYSGAWKKVTLA